MTGDFQQVGEELVRRLGYIYVRGRPLMYAGNADALDGLLWTLNNIWAAGVGRVDGFFDVLMKQGEPEQIGVAGFAHRYRERVLNATEDEIAAYVVYQWRSISKQLSVPITYEWLSEQFPADQQPTVFFHRSTVQFLPPEED